MEKTQQFSVLKNPDFDLQKYLAEEQTRKKHTVPMHLLRIARLLFRSVGPIAPNLMAKAALKLFLSPRIPASNRPLPSITKTATPLQIPHKKELLQGFVWGKEDAPTVLFAHGWETKGLVFRSFVQPLLDKGYRVAVFDAPAHGQSKQQQTHVVDYGEAIETAILQLGNVVALIGHSFGGDSSAFLMAHTSKDIQLERLVLIGAPAKLEYVIARTADFLQLPSSVKQALIALLEKRLDRSIREMSVSEIGDLIGQRVEATLLVHDRYDEIVPFSDAETIADNWEDIHFLITEGYGHNRILRNQSVVDKIVAFLEEEATV